MHRISGLFEYPAKYASRTYRQRPETCIDWKTKCALVHSCLLRRTKFRKYKNFQNLKEDQSYLKREQFIIRLLQTILNDQDRELYSFRSLFPMIFMRTTKLVLKLVDFSEFSTEKWIISLKAIFQIYFCFHFF